MAHQITLPTQRNRDAGIVLVFLSLVFYFLVPPLTYEFGLSSSVVLWWSTPVGTVCLALGLAFLVLSRKKVWVEKSALVIRDGFFSRALRFPFASVPSFKLSGAEEDLDGKPIEIWTVHMIDEGKQYLIDRRIGQQVACRALAERLTKAVGGTLVEVQEGVSHEFSVDELDLSFSERAKRYPQMLGHPVERPKETVIELTREPGKVEVCWCYLRSGLLWEVLLISGLLYALAFVPLPGGPDGLGFTLFELERSTGNYGYFVAVTLFCLVSIIALSGYRNKLVVSPDSGVRLRTTIWGVPIRGAEIPLDHLEHVAVSLSHRGPYLQLISDRKILRERLPSTLSARWVAWEIRSFLAALGGAQTVSESQAS